MKKIINSMMALAIAAFTLTACQDVPSPYPMPKPAEPEVITYTGSGTLEDPYTASDAIKYAQSLGGEESPEAVYVKGKVAAVSEQFSTQYGNGTFTISDDGSEANPFTAYRVLYLGNQKFKSSDTPVEVGDEVILYGNIVNFRGNTPETVQGSAYLYSLNGKTAEGSGGEVTPSEPKGDGTLASPFNAAAAIAYAQNVGDTESDKEVYIAGKVSAIDEQYGTQYGNGSFSISDDGTTATSQFKIWRALYLGNQKFAAGNTEIQVGDDVIVCGKVTNFKGNTPETVQGKAYLYSLNGQTAAGGGQEPTPSGQPAGSGTQADPYNVAAIAQFVGALEADVDTEKELYVKGIVTEIPANGISTQHNNLTFYISDDKAGSNKFYIYRAKGLNGGDVTENMLKVGDEVVVFGSTWVNYRGNTPETKQGAAYIVAITPSEGGGEQPGSGDNPTGGEVSGNSISIQAEDFGFDDKGAATSKTLSDGTEITFDKNTGSTAPTYYAGNYASVRVYANNTITITAKKAITKVAFVTTDPSQSDKYNGSDGAYAESGSTKVNINKESDTSVSFSGLNGTTVKITNYNEANSKNQLRIKTMTITYAE